MGYSGTTAPIPLGQLGLVTDKPMSEIPPNAAIKANNVSLTGGQLSKAGGSTPYTDTALDAGIVAVFDWWPTSTSQRLVAVTSNGKIWRDTGDGSWATSTAITTGLNGITAAKIVAGGAETSSNNRKLFFFTGTNQVRVLSGDGSSTSAIGTPAADWSSSYPTAGLVYNGRMLAFGNPNAPHNLYISKLNDHENFASGGSTAADSVVHPIFSGEGDGLVAAIVYKGAVLLFKKPCGVYVFSWEDQSSLDNIRVERYSDSFGLASANALAIVGDDLWGGTNSGTVTSLKASQAYGSFEAGDILAQTEVRNYVRSQLVAAGYSSMHALYYPEKELAMFTGRSNAGLSYQDRILIFDMSKQVPRLTIETKDTPSCLALRKDSNGVPRPIYGTHTGLVLQMDQDTRNVNDAAYVGEFQTAYTDFGFMDASLTEKIKLFDFLQISFTSTGNWSFFVDVYVDGRYRETLEYVQSLGVGLDTFELDEDELSESIPQSVRKPLHCSGRSISFRIYNTNVDEFFKVERLVVSFRVGKEREVIAG